MGQDVFDREAARYDAWYETLQGATVFAEEVQAVQPLLAGLPRPWLEIGVGSGRFAAALGVEVGIDPAYGALTLAARRGVRVAMAHGESLPFGADRFGAALFVLTLCFVSDPLAALCEARRVLRPDGGVVFGLLLAEGPWAQHYQALAVQGHPYYRSAHFFSRSELTSLLASAQLDPVRTRSALFHPPEATPAGGAARKGDDLTAGFTALLARPMASRW